MAEKYFVAMDVLQENRNSVRKHFAPFIKLTRQCTGWICETQPLHLCNKTPPVCWWVKYINFFKDPSKAVFVNDEINERESELLASVFEENSKQSSKSDRQQTKQFSAGSKRRIQIQIDKMKMENQKTEQNNEEKPILMPNLKSLIKKEQGKTVDKGGFSKRIPLNQFENYVKENIENGCLDEEYAVNKILLNK